MDRERWDRIQVLFHEAAELPAAHQREFLEARCAGDPALVAEVLALLEEDANSESFLNQDLAQVAGRILAEGESSPPPHDLGPYRLRELLGEGGMGVVYLAERADLQSRVAIKILRDAWLSPARRERFASEQRTLAQLNHPCIARLYDADSLPDGTPWFAMEYVDGVPITQYCAERATSVRRTLELFRAVCEAVLHAHQHAVIHRDLKPSNILVTREGQPKLLDFGIAKQIEGLDPRVEWTRAEFRLMTPAYAAPEQIQGEGQGVHTDVYSLGAILYELLAGRPPFELSGKTPTEAFEVVTRQTSENPSIAARTGRDMRAHARLGERGAAWADLDVLCTTAMQKDPAQRYRSVESLIRDVDHYLRGEPLEARPVSIRYRAGKFVRRHWRPLAVAAAVLVTGAGLVTFYTVRLTAAHDAAVAETERTRRIQSFMNNLFEGGDPAAGPADSLRVVVLLDRGVHDANALSGEPTLQADLYETLGEIYQKLGQFERADSLLQAALDRRREHLDPDHPDVAKSLVALGVLRADQSEYHEAERLVREGLALSRRRARTHPAAVARASTALGLVLENRGEYEQAIEVLEEAARLDSAAGLPAVDRAATLTELANSHFYAGNYAVADSINVRVLSIERDLYGDRHPYVAASLVNLGATQQEWGHWPEAERYYREALAIYRGWYGENHYETAATLNMVGRTLVQQERAAEARELLQQALAIRERIYGPVHPSVASTLNELGLLAQREGHLDDAEANFRRMIEIYRQVFDDKHYLIGLAYSNLAGVFTDRRDYREAERNFREALRRYDETLPAAHLYFGITRLKLGRAFLRAERYVDAERETRTGYEIVRAQSEPSVGWLKNAREDLIAEYEALGRPADATAYRAEMALAQASADSAAAASASTP
jgi:serine/threonine-protein kinase